MKPRTKLVLYGLLLAMADAISVAVVVGGVLLILLSLAGCASAGLCVGPNCALSSELSASQPHPAIVRISVDDGGGETSYGSGTLIGKGSEIGLVITNWHVVRDRRGEVRVHFPDNRVHGAQVRAVSQDWDLALLAIRTPLADPLPIAKTVPKPGDPLSIAGYGNGMYRIAGGQCTKYYSPRVGLPQDLVEVSTPSRQGDSGGPILNARGELAGVLCVADGGGTMGSHALRVEQFLKESGVQLLDPPANNPSPKQATPPSLLTSPPLVEVPPATKPGSAYADAGRIAELQRERDKLAAELAAAQKQKPLAVAPVKPADPEPTLKSEDTSKNGWQLLLEFVIGLATSKATAFLVGLGVPSGLAGWGVWLAVRIARRRIKKRIAARKAAAESSAGGAAVSAETFPEPPLSDRADEYGPELVRLHGLEGRNPLHDATCGRIFQDEVDKLAAGEDQVAAEIAAKLKRAVTERFNSIHPLAVKI